VIHGHAKQAHSLDPANQPPQVLHDKDVGPSLPQFRADLLKFGPIQPFTLARRGDSVVFDRSRIHVGDDLLDVVGLVVKADFLLIRAAADPGHDVHDQFDAVARHQFVSAAPGSAAVATIGTASSGYGGAPVIPPHSILQA